MKNNEHFYNSLKALRSTFSPYSPARWLRERKFLYYIKNSFVNTGKILDIGCGRSTLLNKIKDRYKNINLFGTEYSEVLTTMNAQINKNMSFKRWDLETDHIPFELDLFDLIVSQEVIEHLSEDSQKALLKKIYLLLKNDGFAIISTPYKDGLQLFKKLFKDNGESYNDFAKKMEKQPIANHLLSEELLSILKDAGFTILNHTVVGPAFKNRYLTIILSGILFVLPQIFEEYLIKNKILIGRFQIVHVKK